MIWKGQDRRTVFIFGAGATRGALGHVMINRKRLKPPLNGDFFRVAKTFVNAHAESSGLRGRYTKLLAALKDEFKLKGDPQMEEAFSLLSTRTFTCGHSSSGPRSSERKTALSSDAGSSLTE